MSGAIPSSLEDRGADDGRGSFADAPEVLARKAEQERVDPDVALAHEAASGYLNRAQAAEEALATNYENTLDNVAYSVPIEDVENPAEIADVLLAAGNTDRMTAFVEEWSAQGPWAAQEALAWSASREALITSAAGHIAAREQAEAQEEKQAQDISEIAGVLAKETERAMIAAKNEYEIRAAFSHRRNVLNGHSFEKPNPMPEFTLDNVLGKTAGKELITPEQAQAVKAARDAEFRAAFAQARPLSRKWRRGDA